LQRSGFYQQLPSLARLYFSIV